MPEAEAGTTGQSELIVLSLFWYAPSTLLTLFLSLLSVIAAAVIADVVAVVVTAAAIAADTREESGIMDVGRLD